MEKNELIIKGARQHNLKNINLTLPRNKLIVITGLSGSGKSSLAFDTIYAEGQRRYVESLSAYARQFLGQMEKPDIDYIEGLSPAISIEQKTTSKNPRSTVGTITEIYDYFRLLFARCGTPFCYKCGKPISRQSIDQIMNDLLLLPIKTKLQILSPIVRGRKGEYKKELENLRKEGYIRVKINGEIRTLDEEIKLDKNKKHDIDVIIDRIVIKDEIRERLADSVETALKMSDGIVKVLIQKPNSDDKNNKNNKEIEKTYSEKFGCHECGISLEEIQPRLFSFNSPFGACPVCHGLGEKMEFDPSLIIPNESLTIRNGAITTFKSNISDTTWYKTILESLGEKYDFDFDTPIKDFTQKQYDTLMYGSKEEFKIKYKSKTGKAEGVFHSKWEGLLPMVERRHRETSSDEVKSAYEQYMKIIHCPACKGHRLKPEALSIKIDGKSIYEITQMNVKDELKFFKCLKFDETNRKISDKIMKEIVSRLSFLNDVGLSYLTLDRKSGTLSGGESQRIRLATQIGSQLVGVMYVLDEPTIGLHQRDNEKLIKTLKHLRDLGNTLIVVEHDEQTIRTADYIVDLGPGAGVNGGNIVFEGTNKDLLSDDKSLTGAYINGKKKIETPLQYHPGNDKKIILKGANKNNLKNIDVEFPLGKFIAVTGVSGSGKSTLVNMILYKAIQSKLNRTRLKTNGYKEIKGVENIDKIIDIDQAPIGRTPRSNPATYTGMFTSIRELFAAHPEAKVRGYKPGRFSFNVKGGRCENCQGAGQIKIEMHFLPDIYVRCDVCKGKRYNTETLQVKYKGKSISDVLDMTVDEALEHFSNIPGICKKLNTLSEVGLGYIGLGQSATTLSGGEAQRIKLASELSKRSTGKTLYLLDEPTTGLHFDDVRKLIDVMVRFVDQGNTVLVIEHNLDVIKMADHIIDMGPEGGDGGGQVIFAGTPKEIIKEKKSFTGKFLKDVLK